MKGRGSPPLWICLRPRTTGIWPCQKAKFNVEDSVFGGSSVIWVTFSKDDGQLLSTSLHELRLSSQEAMTFQNNTDY